MYSDKKSIQILVALLKEHGVTQIALCPGSRNTPIVHSLAGDADFTCYALTDERSAGFFALGLALHGGRPAAICCTSGTALLNVFPAVAEAFYQKAPLVVISADRPAAWIGQMDGQTIPQPGVFGPMVKKSVQLPEIHDAESEWFCGRLINEALLETNHHGKGPVHINVPLSEPLFGFHAEALPKPRVITRFQGLNIYERPYDNLIERLNRYGRRMMLAGQANLIYEFERRSAKLLYKHFAWLAEHTANRVVPGRPIRDFDAVIYGMPKEERPRLVPDLLITYGGHVVSKRLKELFRQCPPKEHWHVAPDGEAVDTFGCLTTIIEMDPFEFLEKIGPLMENRPTEFPRMWEQLAARVPEPEFAYSAMAAVGALLRHLPGESTLHLGNSSAVRYAQLYAIPADTEVCCNRGTNGIEGSLSTALGYAIRSARPNFLVIGDLSFFYDMNALWQENIRPNTRVLLLNNGGGEIFRSLPGLEPDGPAARFIQGRHQAEARAWAEDRGFRYLPVRDQAQLDEAIPELTRADADRPVLVEVFTDPDTDVALLKDYYHGLRPLFAS